MSRATAEPDPTDSDTEAECSLPTEPADKTLRVIALLLLAILLVIANPSSHEFNDYIRQFLAREGVSTAAQTRQAAARLELLGVTPPVDRIDFVVFSLYRVRIGADTEWYWIGVLRRFISWPKLSGSGWRDPEPHQSWCKVLSGPPHMGSPQSTPFRFSGGCFSLRGRTGTMHNET
jgi:hypothetical protein